jgi:hypothetical protein
MITEFMRLTTTRDAATWAANMGLQNDEQEKRVAAWLWANKPAIGCTYAEHPVKSLSEDAFWSIADGARTLDALINEFGSNAFVIADAGNGSGFGEKGVATEYDDDAAASYGAVVLAPLAAPHTSDDGHECAYASEWIAQGTGDNPYRVRIYF